MIYLRIFFFWRKISPELNLLPIPLSLSLFFLLKNTGPELRSMPIFLYFICGMLATAWLAKWCHVHTRDLNWRKPGCGSRTCELNCCATGLALKSHFYLFFILSINC